MTIQYHLGGSCFIKSVVVSIAAENRSELRGEIPLYFLNTPGQKGKIGETNFPPLGVPPGVPFRTPGGPAWFHLFLGHLNLE